MAKPKYAPKRTLGVFTLGMINVAAIISLKNFPYMAEYGWTMFFYYAVAAIGMFLPTALVSAELATAWPLPGGVYAWVREAFGKPTGFLAVWLQWVNNVPYFPAILGFFAVALAYAFFPSLEKNNYYSLFIILVFIWGATFANFRGMKLSGLISSVGTMIGTLIPGAILILLATAWILTGKGSQLSAGPVELIPKITNLNQMVLLAGVLLSFAGMEMSAVHALEVKNPQRDYPRAIFFSLTLIVLISVLGSLAIAIAVPTAKLGLVTGIMESFRVMFDGFGFNWLARVFSALIALGVLATVSTWVIGPSKGLFATAHDGEMPPVFEKLNRHHVPRNVLIAQAAIVSLVAILVYSLVPNVNEAYWILTALTAQVYLLMYVIMFITAIVLRYKEPKKERPYRIPWGNFGMWLVAGLGILSGTFGIVLGFIPPAGMKFSTVFYETFLIGGLALIVIIPYIIHAFRKPSWVDAEDQVE